MPKARIVVVEDEPAIRRGVADALRLSGYEVTEAPDGAAGLTEGAAAGVDLPGAGDDDQAWEPIAARLRALGLPAERLSIRREGERVTIAGPVPDPAVQERIVAAAAKLGARLRS